MQAPAYTATRELTVCIPLHFRAEIRCSVFRSWELKKKKQTTTNQVFVWRVYCSFHKLHLLEAYSLMVFDRCHVTCHIVETWNVSSSLQTPLLCSSVSPCPSWPQVTTVETSSLSVPYKCNHTVYIFLSLDSLVEHIFEVQMCGDVCQ